MECSQKKGTDVCYDASEKGQNRELAASWVFADQFSVIVKEAHDKEDDHNKTGEAEGGQSPGCLGQHVYAIVPIFHIYQVESKTVRNEKPQSVFGKEKTERG
jgi:hypothetical protein